MPWPEAEEFCLAGRALERFDMEGMTISATEAASVGHDRCDHGFLSATEVKQPVKLALQDCCASIVPNLSAIRAQNLAHCSDRAQTRTYC